MLVNALVTILLLFSVYPAQLSKSVILSPLVSSQQGATVIIQDSDVNESNWYINVTRQNTWHFLISLDSTWGINVNQVSTITITINGTSESTDIGYQGLFTAFTIPSSNEYIVTQIYMRNNENNKITPNCYGNAFYSGNLDPMYDLHGLSTRQGNLMDGGNVAASFNYDYLEPSQNVDTKPDDENKWPMTFVLKNDIFTNKTYIIYDTPGFTTFESQQCILNTAIPFQNRDKGMDIYFAASTGSKLTINSFIITSSATTRNPTSDPTAIPTGVLICCCCQKCMYRFSELCIFIAFKLLHLQQSRQHLLHIYLMIIIRYFGILQ